MQFTPQASNGLAVSTDNDHFSSTAKLMEAIVNVPLKFTSSGSSPLSLASLPTADQLLGLSEAEKNQVKNPRGSQQNHTT